MRIPFALTIREKDKKRKYVIFFFLLSIFFALLFWKSFAFFDTEEFQESIFSENTMKVSDLQKIMETSLQEEKIKEYSISEGDIPADVFRQYGGWDANDVEALLKISESVYDFSSLKIGRSIRFFFEEEDKAIAMEYDCDTEKMISVRKEGENFLVEEKTIEYHIVEEKVSIVIDSFLFKDALEQGLTEATILELSDIFAYAIDFTTEIREGDVVTLVYQKRFRNEKRGPDGKILGAKFTNGGKDFFAYYFQKDGEGNYYDNEGHIIAKQFLRAPLNYRQITSGFTGARLHPITKKVTAHYQIDYSAPIGTPVVSTARGVVTSLGWEGGWGNIVRIEHDNGYTTHYAHLSSFAKSLQRGARVSQGQIIGYVGSTGWSTGPHLDYGMRLNGAPVNPLSFEQPKGILLEEKYLEEFNRMKEKYQSSFLSHLFLLRYTYFTGEFS